MKVIKGGKKRQRIVNRVLLITLIPLLGLFVWSGSILIPLELEVRAAGSEYVQLREIAGGQLSAVPILRENSGEDAVDVSDEEIDVEVGIDWDALFAINPNVVGWIYVPDTGISYPIVQGRDNERYLWHTFQGIRNNSGAIFMDYLNAPDFSDPLTLIYGHNMQSGSMFAPLHDWQGEHFFIHTPDGVSVYEVSSRRIVSARDELFSFVLPEDADGSIVMLSTCVFQRPAERLVIEGTRIN